MTASGEPETAPRVKNWLILSEIGTELNFDKGKHSSPDEQCEFMYYKMHDMSNTGFKNGTDLEKYVCDEITTKTAWKMDTNAGRIGNDGALSLVEAMEERMARMEKKLTEQAKELAEQKEKIAGQNRQLWKVRVSELERIIKKTHIAVRFERNEIIHGADVLNDYQALEYADRPDNQDQFNTASKGFEKAYGLRLGSLSYDNLSKAPEEIIDILSLRGNLIFLNWFSNHKEDADFIAKQCDSAVCKWLESTQTDGVPYPKDAVKADYERVKELYDEVRNQEVW